VSNLTPLSGLSSLNTLELVNAKVTNVGPLANVASLQRLFLRNNDGVTNGNAITDVSALAGLANLLVLDLKNNNIADISALAANPNFSPGDRRCGC